MAKDDDIKDINEVTLLSAAFVRWGLGLFIFSLIIGYGPLVHYLHGALEGRGGAPLENLALWLGCPTAIQIGALGMVAIGAVFGLFPAEELEAEKRDYAALWLCVGGLIAIFLTGYLGYYVLNTIWQTFLGTEPTREKAWLLAYSISAGAYLIGVALTYFSILDLTRYKSNTRYKSKKS
jgi:hypothetical protein